MTTKTYCQELLEAVEAAGADPDLAYLARTRVRRALIALERGRSDEPVGLLADAPDDIRVLVTDLAARATWLCQPSEALDVRWKRDWSGVLRDIAQLRRWVDRA
jgi:hypothetical protein